MAKKQSGQPDEGKQSVANELGIVTSDADFGWRRLHIHLSPKIVGIIVLVLALGGGAWYGLANRTNLAATSQNIPTKLTPQRQSIQDAQNLALNGDYNGAQVALDAQIAATSSAVDKGQFYETKASNALNDQQFAAAWGFATEAEKLNPTSNTSYLIAAAAEGQGDKTTAVAYYQKALARLDQSTRQRAPDIAQTYQDKIKELSQ